MDNNTEPTGADAARVRPHVRVERTIGAGLSERLREAMTAADVTHATAAARLVKSRATVSNWLAGHGEPALDELDALADLCGVRVEWLTCASGAMYEPGKEPDAPPPAPAPAIAPGALERLAAARPPEPTADPDPVAPARELVVDRDVDGGA